MSRLFVTTGASYSFCLKTTSTDQVYVEDILAVGIVQNGGGLSLTDALTDPFTSYVCDAPNEVCRITVIFDQRWFLTTESPGALAITGSVLIGFGAAVPAGRQLRMVSFGGRELEDETATNKFEANVDLSAEIQAKSAGRNVMSSSSIMMGAVLMMGAIMNVI
jgi:hypothetical protein